VIAIMTPTAIENTGWKIYLLFCIFLALSVPFVYFFLPEVRRSHSGSLQYELILQ
jgi:membrane protein implicated in regulation of membrane protease activity